MNKAKISLCRIVIIALPSIIGIYAFWYCNSDYQQLSSWYLSLNPTFYKSADWQSHFFTEEIKLQGNLWCYLAFSVSIILAFLMWRISFPIIPLLTISRKNIYSSIVITVVAIILSSIVNKHASYANDEIFSALHFASIPSFQGFSYYILPNNHLLFNLLNGLFSMCNEMVQSGRLISMICYIITLNATWYFLKKFFNNIYLNGSILLFLAVQFSAWGFSAQARGYEMVLMFSILSFISFWMYWVEKKEFALIIHSIALIAGILTIPSFFYWWLGLFIAASIIQINERKFDGLYFRSIWFAISLSLLMSLPVLTFSGLASLTENGYVGGGNQNSWQFLQHFNKDHILDGLTAEWFCNSKYHILFGSLILIIPAFVFFLKRKQRQYEVTGIFYFSQLLGFVIITVVLGKFPFHRNLIAHSYIIPMFAAMCIASIIHKKKIQSFYAFFLTITAVYYAFQNYKRIPDDLYYYGINEQFNKLNACQLDFKANSSVYLHEDCYYWWYILNEHYPNKEIKILLNKPSKTLADYRILPYENALSKDTDSLYIKMETCNDFVIYKKKQ